MKKYDIIARLILINIKAKHKMKWRIKKDENCNGK